MSEPVIIYHASCADGFTAAWVAKRFWPEAELLPAQYGDEPPDVALRHVMIVDFSYSREDLVAMHEAARSLRVFDHHKTAEERLRGLDFATFDVDRSGAGLTWDLLMRDQPRPWLVDYVEDRDLWNWALPDSREVSAGLASYEFDLDTWDAFAETPQTRLRLANEGSAILRYQARVVASQVEHALLVPIGGHMVPVVNATVLISEIGHALAKGKPFSATWFRSGDGDYIYSLRSDEDGFDVNVIARQYDGGGHKHAAGFKVPELLST